MKKLFLQTLVISLILTACTNDIIDSELPIPESEDVVYSPYVKSIMHNYCVNCHSGASPAAGVTLDNYDDIKHYTEQGYLIERMNNESNPMPPNGMLTVEIRSQLQGWADNNYPR
jgi:uncharacterized membrane protein